VIGQPALVRFRGDPAVTVGAPAARRPERIKKAAPPKRGRQVCNDARSLPRGGSQHDKRNKRATST